MNIQDMILGNKKFRQETYPSLQDDFKDLIKNNQRPDVLFITCSDSRLVPDLIVGSHPGDMFILRNIGNLVPPYENDKGFHASSSVVQYATSVLNVKTIIVCGHSYCGACASVYEGIDENNIDLQHVRKWLKLAKKARDYVLNTLKLVKKDEILRAIEKESVKNQIDNLLTYPVVKQKVKEGKLEIYGWYYKIEDGHIEVYDEKSDTFTSLD